MSNIHENYDNLTEEERERLDVAFKALTNSLRRDGILFDGGDQIERSVDAVALAIISARALQEFVRMDIAVRNATERDMIVAIPSLTAGLVYRVVEPGSPLPPPPMVIMQHHKTDYTNEQIRAVTNAATQMHQWWTLISEKERQEIVKGIKGCHNYGATIMLQAMPQEGKDAVRIAYANHLQHVLELEAAHPEHKG
jgi:hypothetical protein